MNAEPKESETPLKADPETLVLRGAAPRIIRYRRSIIVALAAGVSVAICGATWFALRPSNFNLIPDRESDPILPANSDAIAGAPASYAEIPKLGPPLPGDLGRPILNRREAEAAALPEMPAQSAEESAEAERQRQLAEERAARTSGVMMTGTASGASIGTNFPETSEGPGAGVSDSGEISGLSGAEPGEQNSAGDVNPHRLAPAASPWTIQAGSVIAASLITGLNSQLPGLVTAQVTENVHDSITGRILLIPQGARLIGTYDNVVAFGQSRALVAWHRLILPDGSSLELDNVPATDTEGYAGLSDRVDRHSWQLFKGVMLSTVLGVGTELSVGSEESDLVRALRESAQQSGARAGDQFVARSLDIQPTLQVRPGWPLRVVVRKDLVLKPWEGKS